jgi:hypothetical protein
MQVRTITTLCLGLLLPACSSATSPVAPGPMSPSIGEPMAPGPSPAPAPVPTPAPPAAPETARYRVTFDSTWSATTHPQDFPPNAHFSGLIGGTHNATATFWEPGTLATVGIQSMAERGSKAQLQQEVERAIAAGSARLVLSGGNLAVSPASTSMEFEMTKDFPLVTLVTMVAPSPDWFVGVAGLALFESGAWKDDVRAELFAYDAGTDSGVTFSSPDEETRPHAAIVRITGFPFLNGPSVAPLGTFRFERIAP